jgi:hypothetical protein
MKPGNRRWLNKYKKVPKAVWMVDEIPKLLPIVSTYSLWVNPLVPTARVKVFDAMLLSDVAEHDWPVTATSNNTSNALCLYI